MKTDRNTIAKVQADSHPAQANRVADYLEQNPGSTAKEIDAVCDAGCITKVLSAMKKELGYGISTGLRIVTCAAGTRTRQVHTYTLLYRPRNQADLFTAMSSKPEHLDTTTVIQPIQNTI